MNSKKKIREFVLLEKSTPRKNNFHPQQHFIHQNMKLFALNEGQKRHKAKTQLSKTKTAYYMNEKAAQSL